MPEKDITSRDDLVMLMEAFYGKLLNDPRISYMFTEVAGIEMKQHLPILVDFWDTLLFQTASYQKNAIQPHLDLNEKSPLLKTHFQIWLKYFEETVDQLFEGDNATLAKQRAHSIATIMQIKLRQTGN